MGFFLIQYASYMNPENNISPIRRLLVIGVATGVGLIGGSALVHKTENQVNGIPNIVDCPTENPHAITTEAITTGLGNPPEGVVQIGGYKDIIGNINNALEVRRDLNGGLDLTVPGSTRVSTEHNPSVIQKGVTIKSGDSFIYSTGKIIYEVTSSEDNSALEIKATC